MTRRVNLLPASVLPMLLVGGCTSLGAHVSGNFACRASEGSCAPTSLIDSMAGMPATRGKTEAMEAPRPVRVPDASTTDGRDLQIVIAATRDAQGRLHEARVVRTHLREPAVDSWKRPLGNSAILRALGEAASDTAGAAAPSSNGAEPGLPGADPKVSDGDPAKWPIRSESPHDPADSLPAVSGAPAPDTGAPGRPSSPDRVPHPLPDADEQP